MSNGIVNIHGKEYQTVAKRVADFRETYKQEFSIETDVISNADLVIIKASIKDRQGFVVATGYAEEVRGSSNINKTSALENCETSAVGRALAFFGLAGTEIASADEVNGAIIAGAKKEVADYFVEYNAVVKKYWLQLVDYIDAVHNEDYQTAFGMWMDIPEEDRNKIASLAPTKGGALSTKARDIIKSNEFAELRKQYYGSEE